MRERKETIKPGLYFVFLILLLVSACAPEAILTNDEDSTSEDSPFARLSIEEGLSQQNKMAKIHQDRAGEQKEVYRERGRPCVISGRPNRMRRRC